MRLAPCSLITIKIRDKGAFHWLMLLTVEILHLSVFAFFRASCRKRHIFSLIFKRVNIYHHLLIKLHCSTCKFRCNFSGSHFTTCSEFLQLVLQLFSACFSIIVRFHICLFQPNLLFFFTCSLISVMTDGQAEKGMSKFIIRKEWYYVIIY